MTYRINNRNVDPRHQNDVVVEKLYEGEWVEMMSFNSLSNDYAYTNARDYMKLLEQVDSERAVGDE